MILRIGIVALVALLVVAGWALLRLWRARRLERLGDARPFAGLLPEGRPAVVAFTAPGCGECRSRQAPALARLAAEVGDAVAIRTLSAPEHGELVAALGILTVPATAVLDARGAVRHLNLGTAGAPQLLAQLRAIAETPNAATAG